MTLVAVCPVASVGVVKCLDLSPQAESDISFSGAK